MGAVPLVSRRACGREIVPGNSRPGRALARRLRRHPLTGSRTRQWPGRGHRSGCGRLRGPVHRRAAARSGAAPAALPAGGRLRVPGLTWREQARLRRLERKLSRTRRGSARCGQVRLGIAQLKGRGADRRKDWVEKKTTDIARRFDLIKVEDLRITNMTRSAKGNQDEPGRNVRQKSGLNRGILRSGWGLLVRRLEEKAPGRVVKV